MTRRGRIAVTGCAFTLTALAGCAGVPATGSAVESPVARSVPPLHGWVEFGDRRHTAANLIEVASGATVSVIDPISGDTIATTRTDSSGEFLLTFDRTFVPGQGPYYVEAIKGLRLGGAPNRAGAPMVRVRTIVSWRGDWASMTSGGLFVSRTTTALAILASLKGLDRSANLDLIGTVRPYAPSSADGLTTPDSFAGTTRISDVEYHRAWAVVDQALSQDADPVASVFLRPPAIVSTSSTTVFAGPGLGGLEGIAWTGDGWTVSSLIPDAASAGSSVVLRGHGLPRATESVSIRLGSLTCPVLGASADGTQLNLKVPAGATSGSLLVKIGPWEDSTLTLTVL